MAAPRIRISPALKRPLMISTAAARKSVRCEAVAIERITGVKFANMRMRFRTRVKKASQFTLYFSISSCSVANALTTCTPAMFSVMMEMLRSSASITSFCAG